LIQKHGIARNKLHYFLLWCIPCFFYLFMILVIAPNRGAAWFSDDGLFLKMSWEAANGYGWDSMLPQAPSYLLNALLMKFGVNELLYFRIINYSLCFIGATLFFLGLDSRSDRSGFTPLAITASILVFLNSVESPNSLALHFFLIGMGCYFLALKTSSVWKFFLLVLSAVALALCGFTHAAMVIAILIFLVVIWIFDPLTRRTIFPYLLATSLFCLWTWYIYTIGLSTILKVPTYHETSVIELLRRIYLLFKFVAAPLAYFVIIILLIGRYWPKKIITAQTILIFSPLVLALISLMNSIWSLDWKFRGVIDTHQIPGSIYYSLLFIIFSVIRAAYCGSAKYKPKISINLRHFFHQWIEKASYQTQNYKIFLAVFGFFLLPAGLAAGSNTAILVGLVYFAGPAVGIAMLLWSNQVVRVNNVYIYAFGASWILVFLVFTLYYNHPAANPPINGNKVVLTQPYLSSILETRQYQKSMTTLETLFKENDCKDKLLIALDNIPTIYYIFQHPSPPSIGIVRPHYYFPSDQIIELLRTNAHWCAIDITGTETKVSIDQKNGVDSRGIVRSFLKSQSSRSYDIEVPSENFVGDIQLYVR